MRSVLRPAARPKRATASKSESMRQHAIGFASGRATKKSDGQQK
jgi:hypothetical protein